MQISSQARAQAGHSGAAPAVRFSKPVINALLSRLSTDDSFRELFTVDPREALRLVGHETPSNCVGIPGLDPVLCCTANSLASKATIASSRELLCERMQIHDPFAYFQG